MNIKLLFSTFALAALCTTSSFATLPLGSGFTYQGRLNDGGQPANGNYDMIFNLYDAPTNGNVLGTFSIFGAVPVTNGLFTVDLNSYGEFGANAFDGQARWLQIGVRTNNNSLMNPWVYLNPRQPLTPAPQAIFAMNASNAMNASIAATVADGSITSVKIAAGALAWTNVVGRPAPYTAGAGLSLNASNQFSVNFGTNGVAATAARSDHSHFGETWTGSYIGGGLTVINSQENYAGLWGVDTSPTGVSAGVYGQSVSPNGYGLLGYASSTNGQNVGVFGQSDSSQGIGVQGYGKGAGVFGVTDSTNGFGVAGMSSAASGANYGVIGRSDSAQGYGVYGFTTAVTGTNIGVFGESDSTYGYGVQGKATSAGGVSYGVGMLGESASTQGSGVWGKATSLTGFNCGVRAESASTSGAGVSAVATAATGITEGVAGQANSTSGIGVRGLATGGTGTTIGVNGEAYSAQGYGVLARNDNGVALKASGTGIIQSDADSYVMIPAGTGQGFYGDDRNGTMLSLGDYGFGHDYGDIPLTLPSMLYGQSTLIKSIEIFYQCQDNTKGFITNTVVTANFFTTIATDSTSHKSNNFASYTMNFNPPIIAASTGFLGVEVAARIDALQGSVMLHGIKVRLGHN